MKINLLVNYLISSSSLVISNVYKQLVVYTSVPSEGTLNSVPLESSGSHKIFALLLTVTLIMIIVGLVSTFVTKFALSIREKKE